MSNRWIKLRLAVSTILLIVVFLGLGCRLAFLHLGSNSKVSRQIERKIIAGRGNIYDCKNGENLLALNLAVKDVCVDPLVIVSSNRVTEVSSALAQKLGLDVDDIAETINSRSSKRFAYIKRFVQEDKAREVCDLNLEGVFFQDATIRYYPHGQFMCHTLGFVNYEGIGSLGIEQSFDKYLRGSSGLLESKVDARRRELYSSRGRYIPALEGANVTLTIDQNVQYIVENALDDLMEEQKPAGAWVIVESVRTGEILAMASRPGFDLNEFTQADEKMRLNRAISVNYEPGSTMKALTISAALNENLVTPSTVFDCENGLWSYGGRMLTDGGHSYGRLSVSDVIKKSSNIGTAKIALLLGKERQEAYMRSFGLGSTLGIDIPGEETGILPPVSKWSAICPTRMAFGQAYSVTALQVLTVFCTIANDGYRMKPYIIKEIKRSDGSVVLRGNPEVVNRPIGVEAARAMKNMLCGVTEQGGTGLRACVDGFTVAGKTGTAQKVKNGTYSAWVGSFVGFLPAEDPQIAVIVVVDEPGGIAHAGGVVAAPTFKRVAELSARYLDIYMDDLSSIAKK